MSDRFTVIGLSDNPDPGLAADAVEAVCNHRVFAGGRRHRMLVADLLPGDSRWITIGPPIAKVLDSFRDEPDPVLVFTSGDPLFYGFGATLQQAFPDAEYTYYPSFTSLQMLAHRCRLPYQEMRCASLTGREWDELDAALIEGAELIGILTDRKKNPAALAERMLEYGYSGYSVTVGEALGGRDECVGEYSLEETCNRSFNNLNCVILRADQSPERCFGIPDPGFEGLPGRPNMITKMPVRLVTLSRLDLCNARTFWDVGFCTGSVSIEAKLRFPRLAVTAFEKKEECRTLLEKNCKKYRVPGIGICMGDFLCQPHGEFTDPKGKVDAVFIGGHGGHLGEMFAAIDPLLAGGGRIAINAVQNKSLEQFHALAEGFGYRLLDDITIAVDEHNSITVAAACKQ